LPAVVVHSTQVLYTCDTAVVIHAV